MPSVRFTSPPLTAIESPQTPPDGPWQRLRRKASLPPLSRQSRSTSPTPRAHASSPTPCLKRPATHEAHGSEAIGARPALAAAHRQARWRALPVAPLEAAWPWRALEHRCEGLRRLLIVHAKRLPDAREALVVADTFAPDAPSPPAHHALALRWTGFIEAPLSLEHDGSRFVLFRAARLVAACVPQWIDPTRGLSDARELLAAYEGAMELFMGRSQQQAQAVRQMSWQQAIRPRSLLPSGPLAACSVADQFCLLLVVQDVRRLWPDAAAELLADCRQDLCDAQLDDFSAVLQYYRCAAAAWDSGGLAAWKRVRPLMQALCAYERRLAGDTERVACTPSTLASLLDIESHILHGEAHHVLGLHVLQLCDEVEALQQVLPNATPLPMALELCDSLGFGFGSGLRERRKEIYLQVAHSTAYEPHGDDHPAKRAREHCTSIVLQAGMKLLNAQRDKYQPFARLQHKLSKMGPFAELKQQIERRGFGHCLGWVDALAAEGGWSAAGVLEALRALSSCEQAPTWSEFTCAAMAVLDAQIGEPSCSYHLDSTLRGLYCASGLALLLSTPGLGLTRSHAANVLLVRAWLGPREGIFAPRSIADLSARVRAARDFGLSLQSHPDSRAYAYQALGAAACGPGFHTETLERLVRVIGPLETKGRRLLCHLLREDRRLAWPPHDERLAAIVGQGYAFQKSSSHPPLGARPPQAVSIDGVGHRPLEQLVALSIEEETKDQSG